jgi:hypothetical protein
MRHKAFLKGQSEVFFRLLEILAGTVLLVKAAFPPEMSFVLRQPNKTEALCTFTVKGQCQEIDIFFKCTKFNQHLSLSLSACFVSTIVSFVSIILLINFKDAN